MFMRGCQGFTAVSYDGKAYLRDLAIDMFLDEWAKLGPKIIIFSPSSTAVINL